MKPSAVAQLAAVEECLALSSDATHGMLEMGRWVAAVSARLREIDSSEQGLAAYCQVLLHLTRNGVLAYTDEGTRRSHAERQAAMREVVEQLGQALAVARARILERVSALEKMVEAAIRTAAQNKLLSPQAGRERAEWIAQLTELMADHPASALQLARLALRIPDAELRILIDRVLLRVFGV